MRRSALELLLAAHLQELKTDHKLEIEYKFHDKRKWRFDFAYPTAMLAIEVEGGTWTGGRHVRGKGFEADCTKYNQAVIEGWRVLRFTSSMVNDGRAKDAVREALKCG